MIDIVCLKWGNKYGPEYVNRLYRGIQRNIDGSRISGYRFWCFTDDARGLNPEIKVHDLPCSTRLEIWWNKLWLFSEDMPVDRGSKIFYVDLDTLITGDITDMLLAPTHELVVLRDFYHGIARSAGVMGSGLMAWRHGDYTDIWTEFWKDPETHIRDLQPLGDQKWIENRTHDRRGFWQDLFPDRVISYKVHCAQGLPHQASVICYHGRPSIPESAVEGHDCRTATRSWHVPPQPWVLDHWRD